MPAMRLLLPTMEQFTSISARCITLQLQPQTHFSDMADTGILSTGAVLTTAELDNT